MNAIFDLNLLTSSGKITSFFFFFFFSGSLDTDANVAPAAVRTYSMASRDPRIANLREGSHIGCYLNNIGDEFFWIPAKTDLKFLLLAWMQLHILPHQRCPYHHSIPRLNWMVRKENNDTYSL